MNMNFLGVEVSLTVFAERETRVVLDFQSGDEVLNLDGVTFSAAVEVVGHQVTIPITAIDGLMGKVAVLFPALPSGRYRFEMRAEGQDGEAVTLLFGWLGALDGVLDVADDEGSTDPTLQVQVPARSGEHLLVNWTASTQAAIYAQQAAESAAEAAASAEGIGELIERAQTAVETAEQAVEKLDVVDAKLAMFDDKIASAVIPSPVTNTWWIGGKDTFVPVTGENGKSPQISNVGTWMLWDDEAGTYIDSEQKAVPDDGHSPYISPLGTWMTHDVLNGWIDTGVQAQGVDGLNGVSMRRVIIESVDDLPEGEERGIYYYILNAQDAFDVYAWLETADGSGSWVMIGEANDIATSEVHGLVKLGTDSVIEQGASIGNDDSGALAVPRASVDTEGVVMISFPDVLDEGAAIGFDESGKVRVISATMNDYGSVRLSMSATAQDGCIGLMADGRLGTRRATLYDAGTVKLGSSIQQVNSQPYIIGVGATSDGQIANNILGQGAIQHQRIAAWNSFSMQWLSDSAASNPSRYTADDYYLGLAHTAQFSQNKDEGLSLLSASSSLLAGVYVVTDITDTRPEAVMSASGLSVHLSQTYYTKAQVYTKGETTTADNVVRSWVSSTFVTKESLEAMGYVKGEQLNNDLSGKMDKSGSITRAEALTLEELNELDSRDATTLYIAL